MQVNGLRGSLEQRLDYPLADQAQLAAPNWATRLVHMTASDFLKIPVADKPAAGWKRALESELALCEAKVPAELQ
jgi:hypothetical protein